LVLPGSRARIVRCGGRYDPQLVKRSSECEWVSIRSTVTSFKCLVEDDGRFVGTESFVPQTGLGLVGYLQQQATYLPDEPKRNAVLRTFSTHTNQRTCFDSRPGFRQKKSKACRKPAGTCRKPGLQPGLQLARIMECGLNSILEPSMEQDIQLLLR